MGTLIIIFTGIFLIASIITLFAILLSSLLIKDWTKGTTIATSLCVLMLIVSLISVNYINKHTTIITYTPDKYDLVAMAEARNIKRVNVDIEDPERIECARFMDDEAYVYYVPVDKNNEMFRLKEG